MAKTTKKEAGSTTKTTKASKAPAKAKAAAKKTSATKPAKTTTSSKASKPKPAKEPEAPAATEKLTSTPQPEPESGKSVKHRETKADTTARTTARTRKAPVRSETVTATAPAVEALQPTTEEIALRAYFRYLERGAGHGGDVDDWLEAERELTGTHG